MTRRDDIAEYRRNHPCATLRNIAQQFGVTRERIRQILSREGLPTKRQSFYINRTYEVCPRCGGYKCRKAKFCKECSHEMAWIQVACERCGVLLKPMRVSHLIRNNTKRKTDMILCRHCRGKDLGTKYGFGSHPKHVRRERKYDYALIWQLHLDTGYGGIRLSRQLGISGKVIDHILSRIRSGKAQLVSNQGF